MTGQWKLTRVQRDVLTLLAKGARTANNIAWRLPSAPVRESAVSRTCGRLESAGLAERFVSPEYDKFERWWRITEAGRAALSAAQHSTQGEG